MSANLWIEGKANADLNVTYNLSRMLNEAGFNGWRWCVDKPARRVGKHMLRVLNKMRKDDDRWRAMNPSNGWGDYDMCIQGRMRDFAEACVKAPRGDVIGGWL